MPSDVIKQLLGRGIQIPCPESVCIAPEIPPERFAPGTVIHPGCRILGKNTSIGPGCEIGREAPATVEDCQLGAAVQLKGGYFSQSVFLDRAQMGSGAHVRPGCLLEEDAGGAHAVGLKQTVLLPFVTLGSLINFCDCLMAGGTSRKNHSEVGSGYIHFNFTPHQDKATPSLLGDVPAGVLLDQPPIFLGGQGGLVGPARVAYGVIVPAGLIVRGDIEPPGLYTPPAARRPPDNYQLGRYQSIARILRNNFHYLGNLYALRAWYINIRAEFMQTDPYRQACHAGAVRCLDAILAERLSRLDELAAKMPRSLALHGAEQLDRPALRQQQEFHDQWPAKRAQLAAIIARAWQPATALPAELAKNSGMDYIAAIQALSPAARQAARSELAAIVAAVAELCG